MSTPFELWCKERWLYECGESDVCTTLFEAGERWLNRIAELEAKITELEAKITELEAKIAQGSAAAADTTSMEHTALFPPAARRALDELNFRSGSTVSGMQAVLDLTTGIIGTCLYTRTARPVLADHETMVTLGRSPQANRRTVANLFDIEVTS